MIQLGFKARKT